MEIIKTKHTQWVLFRSFSDVEPSSSSFSSLSSTTTKTTTAKSFIKCGGEKAADAIETKLKIRKILEILSGEIVNLCC